MTHDSQCSHVMFIVKHYPRCQSSLCDHCESLRMAANVPYVVPIVKQYQRGQCSSCGAYCETVPTPANLPYVVLIVKHDQRQPTSYVKL
jgi:hypothetical protein